MASSRLLTKILADFLFGFYLLNWVLKHATNHTQNRCSTFGMKNTLYIIILLLIGIENSYAQNDYDWNSLESIKLYNLTADKYCENVSSTDLDKLNSKSLDVGKIKRLLIESIEPDFDIILESECKILRMKFKNQTIDFMVYEEQNLLIELNDYNKSLMIIKGEGFFEYIKNKVD